MFRGKREGVTTTEVAGQNMLRSAARVQITAVAIVASRASGLASESYLGTSQSTITCKALLDLGSDKG